MGKRTGIYLRISNDREGRELGVQRQEEDCRVLAERSGDTIVDVYRDNDISASTRSRKQRPEYKRLLADAAHGRIEKIISYTSARLTRRPREHENQIELAEKHGTEFAYVASPSFDLNTATGRRVARILAANDTGHSEDISELARRQKRQAAVAGRYRGGRRPFGFESDGITVRESESRVVREMTSRALAGETLSGLARDLNDRGVTTSTGARWTGVSLRDVLMRIRNIGHVEIGGEVGPVAEWPAIVDPESWRAARHLLGDPSRRPPRAKGDRVWMGAGLYRCGVCDDGTTMRSATTQGSGGTKKPAYRCRNSSHVVRVAESVDDLVSAVTVAKLSQPDAVDLYASNRGVDVVALRGEANMVRGLLDELDDDRDQGVIDRARWARRNEKLQARLDDLQVKLASAVTGTALDGIAGREDVGELWGGLPAERRAAIVDILMTVTLLPAPRGRRPGGGYFDPGSVKIDLKRQ